MMGGNVAEASRLVLIVVLGLTAVLDFLRHPKAVGFVDRLRIPPRMLFVLGAVKALAAVGLVAARDNVRLGELTGASLVVYFAIAVVAHLRAKQGTVAALPAVLLMAVSAAHVAALMAQ